MSMKLYVDDTRMPKSEGWTVVTNYHDAIFTLLCFWDSITELSLDHDLGSKETGYDLAKWIEERIEVRGYKPIPKMFSHSANSAGRKNIEAVFTKYNKES